MRRISRRCTTQANQQICIPHLNLLPSTNVPQFPTKYARTKESTALFKPAPIDRNADFVKEKSLYRYNISKKLNQHAYPHSHTCLSTTFEEKRVQQNAEEQPRNRKVSMKEDSNLQESNQAKQDKQRHFKRRNKNQLHLLFQNFSTNLQQTYVNNEQGCQKSKLKESQFMSKKFLQNKSLLKINLCKPKETEIDQLKRSLQELREENENLKDQLSLKSKQLELMEYKFNTVKQQNDRLLDCNKYNYNHKNYSDNFINDNRLEHQLILRDIFIRELQEKIKYIELENRALKKTKNQKRLQQSIILQLEHKIKKLEEKITVLTRIKTKRNKAKGSMISEYSDLSLNLSADQEEIEKLMTLLNTAEKTPDRRKSVGNMESITEQPSSEQLLSPPRKPKARIS